MVGEGAPSLADVVRPGLTGRRVESLEPLLAMARGGDVNAVVWLLNFGYATEALAPALARAADRRATRTERIVALLACLYQPGEVRRDVLRANRRLVSGLVREKLTGAVILAARAFTDDELAPSVLTVWHGYCTKPVKGTSLPGAAQRWALLSLLAAHAGVANAAVAAEWRARLADPLSPLLAEARTGLGLPPLPPSSGEGDSVRFAGNKEKLAHLVRHHTVDDMVAVAAAQPSAIEFAIWAARYAETPAESDAATEVLRLALADSEAGSGLREFGLRTLVWNKGGCLPLSEIVGPDDPEFVAVGDVLTAQVSTTDAAALAYVRAGRLDAAEAVLQPEGTVKDATERALLWWSRGQLGRAAAALSTVPVAPDPPAGVRVERQPAWVGELRAAVSAA